MSNEYERAVYAFIEFILASKPEFIAEKLRPSYNAYAKAFLENRDSLQTTQPMPKKETWYAYYSIMPGCYAITDVYCIEAITGPYSRSVAMRIAENLNNKNNLR